MNKVTLVLCIGLFLGLILFVGCASTNPSSDLFRSVVSQSPIPNGFKSYTLFLVPSYSLSHSYSEAQWKDVLNAFMSFGESIGKQNAAIWFFNSDGKTPSVERARDVVDRINLIHKSQKQQLCYDGAPIIVFMDYNPESGPTEKDYFYTAIQFKGRDPQIVIEFLDRLAQMIRNDKLLFGTLENEQAVTEVYEIAGKVLGKMGEDAIRIFSKGQHIAK